MLGFTMPGTADAESPGKSIMKGAFIGAGVGFAHGMVTGVGATNALFKQGREFEQELVGVKSALNTNASREAISNAQTLERRVSSSESALFAAGEAEKHVKKIESMSNFVGPALDKHKGLLNLAALGVAGTAIASAGGNISLTRPFNQQVY